MLRWLGREDIKLIKNPVFARYALRYQDIYDGFAEQVKTFGLPFSEKEERETERARRELEALPTEVRNNGASLAYGKVSDACAACRTGTDSYTGFISLMCHRNCYYCFNPNQENFEQFACRKKDWEQELEQVYAGNKHLRHIALTGGEPLLHKRETVAYFQKAQAYWPGIDMRLYTSGDLLDDEILAKLAAAGLNEIRFSLKPEDTKGRREKVFQNMEHAQKHIPRVMVEMPVFPDAEAEMTEILERLEQMGIFGINLLELCFPFGNADEFRKRGYALRYPPYRTLYNFWYAGGLPVAGSELLALKLLRFAAEKQYRLNVHYCSLENKHFGQIYMQNTMTSLTDDTYVMSEKDFYLKTIKAFGEEAEAAERALRAAGCTEFRMDKEYRFIQFAPSCLPFLQETDMELAVSYNVKEQRGAQTYIRELRLDYARAGELSAEDI